MTAPPRYHSPGRWADKRGQDIRAAVNTLTRLLDEWCRNREGQNAGWQRQGEVGAARPTSMVQPPTTPQKGPKNTRTASVVATF